MSKLLNLILILAIVGVFIVAVGGGIAGKAAREYAAAGGEVEARAFTTETYSHAEAGDNSVALAITGDHNGVNVAYSQAQPTPAPNGGQAGRSDSALGGFVGALVVGVAFVLCFMYWLMSGNQGSKYS